MFKKFLLFLAAVILIAAGIIWGLRIYRTKKPILLYSALRGKGSVNPQKEEAIKPEIPETEAPIVGATIYQKQVSSVVRCANPGAVKRFRVAGNIRPLSGSITVASEIADVRKIEIAEDFPRFYTADNLTKSFAGKMVTIRFADGTGTGEISGTVIDPEPEKTNVSPEKFVILRLANQRHTMIRRDLIQRIDADNCQPVLSGVQKNIRHCWQFTAAKPLTDAVRFQYLTCGLDWNASLHLTLQGDALSAELYGEIVNNLDELEEVPLILASGTPEFDGGTDPMSLVDLHLRKKAMSAGMMANYAMTADSSVMGVAAPGTQNIRYFPAGKVTMKKGEVLLRKLGSAQGKCERLVVWRTSHNQEGRAMEALRFVNPFTFPIPECTVLVAESGSAPFAQVKGKWLNVGERMTLDLMAAPSVTVKRGEKEIASEAEPQVKGKRRYRLRTTEGVLTIKNHQTKMVKMAVEYRFLGKLLVADGNPETSGFAARYEIDPGCKVAWEFPLAPQEEKKITFRYQEHVQD